MKGYLLWLVAFSVISISIMIFMTSQFTLVDRWSRMKFWNWTKNTKNQLTTDQLMQLIKLTKHLVRAHRYSRSTIAMYELNEAFRTANSLIDSTYNELIIDELINDTDTSDSISLPEVCPEVYMGMMYGYPYYHTGYITNTNNCTSQPIDNLLTVLLDLVNDISFEELDVVLKGLSALYPKITVVIAYNKKDSGTFNSLKGKYSQIGNNSFEVNSDKKIHSSGHIWKTLTNLAMTKYVFIGRGLIHFDGHTSFERLLRFLSYTDANVVGGSHRFMDGRWYRGCYAMGLRNYTLKLVDGYDLSYNSCIYCDYISGPFMTRKEYFLDNIDDNQHEDMVFMDFFTGMKNRDTIILDCPDVMFVVNEKQAVFDNFQRQLWLQYVVKWKLNRIILPNKNVLSFSCSEAKTKCNRVGGLIMPICCLQELLDAIKFFVKIAEKNNIGVELEAGSGIGAVKMYGVIPYERDADFDWMAFNHEKLKNLTPEFEKHNYKLIPRPKEDINKCVNTSGVNCGYFGLRSENWRLELWGVNYLGSDEAFKVGLKHRTKALIDGMWVTVLHSPAQSARNEYGDDLFEHIEHWSTLGHKTGWVQPPTGHFLPCPTPGFHGCLDLFLPVGNIQFQDVWV